MLLILQNTTNICTWASKDQRVGLHNVFITEKAGNRLIDTRQEEWDYVAENMSNWATRLPIKRWFFWKKIKPGSENTCQDYPEAIQFYVSPEMQPSFPNEAQSVLWTHSVLVSKVALALFSDIPFQMLWKTGVIISSIKNFVNHISFILEMKQLPCRLTKLVLGRCFTLIWQEQSHLSETGYPLLNMILYGGWKHLS